MTLLLLVLHLTHHSIILLLHLLESNSLWLSWRSILFTITFKVHLGCSACRLTELIEARLDG